ncbi:MAG: GNAT family N-acetyltransferase [Acidimicrobiales bacterium]
MTQPIDVAVRSATPDDVGALSDFHRQGKDAVRTSRGGELDILLNGRQEPVEATFTFDLDNLDTDVLVGTVDGVTVGYGVVTVHGLPSRESLAVVSDLYVTPRARGVGVGNLLMRRCVDFATARECRGIDARALPGDRETKNFFESFGLVARNLVVNADLR